MGMGYNANFGIVIGSEEVSKVVPTEWKKMTDFMDEKDVTLDDLASSFQYSDFIDNLSEQENDVLEQLFIDLKDAFVQKTQIELMLEYHNTEEEGSRYDEVEGAFFALSYGDVFEYTPVANRLLNTGVKFDLKSWVVFG